MSSAALKKGVEEPWTSERVVKFIDLLCRRQRVAWAHRERDNVAAWNHSNSQVPHREQDAGTTLNDDSLVMPWLVEHAGCILSRCQKGRDGKTPFETARQEADTRVRPVWRESAGKANHHKPNDRMNPRYQYVIWLGMRNNSAECFIGNADGVFRALEIRRQTLGQMNLEEGQTGRGQWTIQKFEWTPFQSLRCRSREHESRGRESH